MPTPNRLRQALLLSCALLGGPVTLSLAAPAAAQTNTHAFKIPAQSLGDALRAFATQSGRDVLFAPGIVAGKSSPGVNGTLGDADALRALLAGTGLTFQVTSSNTYAVMAQSAEAGSAAKTPETKSDAAAAETSPASESNDRESSDSVEKVTVTGSRIRGAKQASPVVTITQEDIRRQGANDLGQAVRSLPQNFNGGQNPAVLPVGGDPNNQNLTGSSSVNLRGLGADATLTLLNGTRLPYDGFSQATDVAVIPVAAVDRLEILLDGASAIYGSDAVGGVVNIILKREFDGVEISARRGRAADGGFEQQQYTGVAGATWNSGGIIVTSDYSKNTDIDAGQRSYLADLPPKIAIYPSSAQTGVLVSGHQNLADFGILSLDAFYTKRNGAEFSNLSSIFGFDTSTSRDSTIWGVAPALRFDLPSDWSFRLHGALTRNEGESDQALFLPDGTELFRSVACYCNKGESAGVEAEGPLVGLPGGDARLAVGAGYRRNSFKSINRLTGTIGTSGEDRSEYIYGELNLPLISPEQRIFLVDRLSMSGAVRYENYASFGETTTPKLGAIWGVTSDVDIKASWGRSYKVPTLVQQFSSTTLDLADPGNFGGVGYPAGSGVLLLLGGNPGLTPERAETLATGFIVRPALLPGFKLEVSRFSVDYTDRVVVPFEPLFTALSNPASFNFVTFAPTVAEQNAAFALAGLSVGTFSVPPPGSLPPYDPARVIAIADGRYVNAAAQQVVGVDVLANYVTEVFDGSLTASFDGTWIERTRTLTALSPEQRTSGLVFYPAEFRGRIGASWTRDGLTLSSYVNRTDGVTDDTVTPSVRGDAMTTLDFTVDYVVASGLWGNELQFNLSVMNLFNSEPPFMQPLFPGAVNYDSTNYSAVGRVVNGTITMRF